MPEQPIIVILAAPAPCTTAERRAVLADLRASLPPGSIAIVVPHGWQRLEVDRAVAEAEREACAAIADEFKLPQGAPLDTLDGYEADRIAARIRARGAP